MRRCPRRRRRRLHSEIEIILSNRKNNLILEFLGRILFPKDASWQRREKIRTLFLSILVGLLVGGVLVLLALLMNKNR